MEVIWLIKLLSTIFMFFYRHFRKTVNIFFQFIPQLLFLVLLFFYLVTLIFFKWIRYSSKADGKSNLFKTKKFISRSSIFVTNGSSLFFHFFVNNSMVVAGCMWTFFTLKRLLENIWHPSYLVGWLFFLYVLVHNFCSESTRG